MAASDSEDNTGTQTSQQTCVAIVCRQTTVSTDQPTPEPHEQGAPSLKEPSALLECSPAELQQKLEQLSTRASNEQRLLLKSHRKAKNLEAALEKTEQQVAAMAEQRRILELKLYNMNPRAPSLSLTAPAANDLPAELKRQANALRKQFIEWKVKVHNLHRKINNARKKAKKLESKLSKTDKEVAAVTEPIRASS